MRRRTMARADLGLDSHIFCFRLRWAKLARRVKVVTSTYIGDLSVSAKKEK